MRILSFVLLMLIWPACLLAQDAMARADSAWAAGDIDTAIEIYQARLARDSSDVTSLHRVGLWKAWNEDYDESLALLKRAVQIRPDYLPAELDRARVLAWADRYDEAFDQIDHILSNDPNNLQALFEKAEFSSWSEKFDQSLQAYDELLELAPDSTQWELPRAKVLGSMGRYKDALAALEGVLSRDPDNVEALEAKAQLGYAGEELQASLDAYDRLLELVEDHDKYVLPRAQVLAALGRYDEALASIGQVLRENPADLDALQARAEVLAAAGRSDEAAAAYERLMAAVPDPTPFRLARAEQLGANDQYDQALEQLDKLLELNPEDTTALQLKAQYASWSDKFDESIAAYRKLLDLSSDPESVRLPLARVLFWAERYEQSLTELDHLLAQQPNNQDALELKAQVASAAGDMDVAEATYKTLIERSSDPTDLRIALARALGEQDRYDEAIDQLNQVLEEDPTNLDALEAKARFASWSGNYKESLIAYDKLVAASPAESRQLLPRAQVLAWDDQYQRAAAAYEDILARSPENEDALVGLGQVLSWAGQLDSATVVYQKALDVEPGNRAARRGMAQVKTWGDDLRGGETIFRELVESDSTDVESILGLASNLRYQGRPVEASTFLDKVRKLEPDNPMLHDERELVQRALAPQATPTFSWVSDSDGNRVRTVGLRASVQLRDGFQLSASTTRRDLQDLNTTALYRGMYTGQVSFTARSRSGWSLTGGLGVWQPPVDSLAQIMTGVASIASPSYRRLNGNLTYQRSAYDITALVTEQNVDVHELGLNAGLKLGRHTTASGELSRAWFQGSETNRRFLAGGRISYRVVPWLVVGPSARGFTFDNADLNDGYWNPSKYGIVELPLTFEYTRGRVTPTIEVAPGYQRITDDGGVSSGGTGRVQAGLSFDFGVQRQLSVTGVYAHAGAQLSSSSESTTYLYRGFTVTMSWAF